MTKIGSLPGMKKPWQLGLTRSAALAVVRVAPDNGTAPRGDVNGSIKNTIIQLIGLREK